ncbi:hypothetical protein PT300_12885 [Enterobacteriaceae bacterium ESL0689]|nr:hypothetical protein [Enterobacteriaceae bacterium ESL0689]
MRYFKIITLASVFFSMPLSSMDFEISPPDEVDGIRYFLLKVKDDNRVRDIDVMLEGNLRAPLIRHHYTFSCQWGDASGVRLSMDSSSNDGPLVFDNIYVLDNKLDIVFAKSYARMNNKWIEPLSLTNAVCKRSGGGVKIDTITNKDFIIDFEFIHQGPFFLKGFKDKAIKYVRNESLNLDLVYEDANGEVVIDTIKNHDNKAPLVRTVFFMNINSEMKIISLVSWGAGDEGYHKVYGYTYDKKGRIYSDKSFDKDVNLSGYNTKEHPFKYKDASSIKEYLHKKFNS